MADDTKHGLPIVINSARRENCTDVYRVVLISVTRIDGVAITQRAGGSGQAPAKLNNDNYPRLLRNTSNAGHVSIHTALHSLYLFFCISKKVHHLEGLFIEKSLLKIS